MFEIRDDSGLSGPYTSADVKSLAQRGELHPQMEIREAPAGRWRPITDVKGISFSEYPITTEPPPVPVPAPARPAPTPLTARAPLTPAPLSPSRIEEPETACPFCSELIKAQAKKCKHCGEILDVTLRAAQERSSGGGRDGVQNVTHVNTVVQVAGAGEAGKRWEPAVAVLLSLIVPGLGQLYKGQAINGIVWFCIVILGYAMLLVPGLILHLCCIAGAGMGDPRR
jgi:hypothetical protein